MNTLRLKAVMVEHGDTQKDIADALGITRERFSMKLNDTGAEFTQGEIDAIRKRYGLTPYDLTSIFFSDGVS